MVKASKIFKDIALCKVVIDKLESDFSNGIISKEDAKGAIRTLNKYLDILEIDVENM